MSDTTDKPKRKYHSSPAQLANLRPAKPGNCPAHAAGKSLAFVANDDTRQCKRIRRNGARCKQVKAHGTDFCKMHGARRIAGLPPKPFTLATRAAYRELQAMRDEHGEIPRELTRQPAWLATFEIHKGHKPRLQVRLFKAWLALQDGQPGPWRTVTQDVFEMPKSWGAMRRLNGGKD